MSVLLAAPVRGAVPLITISAPTSGQVFDSSTAVITITGTVKDPGTDSFAMIFQNGTFQQSALLNRSTNPATFSESIVLFAGSNELAVSDTNADGQNTTSVTVTSQRAANDIRVNLVWDHTSSDVDIYLFVPANPEKNRAAYAIWFGNKNPIEGGSLDVDNVRGLGPENISFLQGSGPPSGQYTLAVNLFRLDNSLPTNSKVTLLLNEGSSVQSITSFDTVTLTVANSGRDVFQTGSTSLPSLTNSTSTFFFTFNFTGSRDNDQLSVITYPNPFLPGSGTVTFSIQEAPKISTEVILIVEIFDLSGRRIASVPGNGTREVTWNGRTNSGQTVSSGTYFYSIRDTQGQFGMNLFTLIH